MLGKLLKYEFRETARPLLLINLILAGLTLLGCLVVVTGLYDNPVMSVFFTLYIALYFFSIIAAFIITIVLLTIRFYKTMFSAQGYLTHTLPAAPSQILHAKILSSSAWTIATALVCIFCAFSFLFCVFGTPTANEFLRAQQELSLVLGIGFYPAVFLMLGMTALVLLANLLMVFACLSIGQTFHQNRIPGAIGAGVVFYMIQQAVSLISLVVCGFPFILGKDEELLQMTVTEMPEFFQKVILFSMGEVFVFGLAYYAICRYIIKNKLNLE